MKKGKIGLVMACNGTSYGMNLQAFATQYIIEKLGYNTEILRLSKNRFPYVLDWHLPYFLLQVFKKRNLKKKSSKSLDEIHLRNKKERVMVAQMFRDNHLKNFTPIMRPSEMHDYLKNDFEGVVVGSDQVWLPGFSFGHHTSLLFVPSGVKRIAYSSSLGVSTYPSYCWHSAKKAWSQFDSIAVREEEGKKIIQQICGDSFPVNVVIDPTYLISKKEWEEIIPKKSMSSEKYILSFILGNNVQQQEYARDFARQQGIKLVSILSNESVSDIDTTYADEIVVGASPEDFLNYIRGAEYIFTDSFHGIAFSVINEKQFFVFYRKREGASGSMSRNSRIDNILRTWNINQHLITDYSHIIPSNSIPHIDYNEVNRLLEEKKDYSIDILTQSLK